MITPRIGMVLAAGRGERMRPITDTMPKPLVTVGGRSLLDHAIDRLADAGVTRVIVNTHYLGEMIARHLAERAAPEIMLSPESQALETGGGVLHALPLLGAAPFFVVNGDSLWLDGGSNALTRLAQYYDPAEMDAVLLLQRTATAFGYDEGMGDFQLDRDGRPRRRIQGEVAPYLFAGIQLLAPHLFDGLTPGRFSLNVIYDRALASGRLRAIVHDGAWFHVGTPQGLDLVRQKLER